MRRLSSLVLTGLLGMAAAPAPAAPALQPTAATAAPAPASACPGVNADAASGADGAALCGLLREFESGKVNFHSVLLERHGRIVAEAYRDGKDATMYRPRMVRHIDAGELHDLRSISKSVVGLLWGIADGQGKLPPLDTPVHTLLPELADLAGGGRGAITLGHLMQMTSGLAWDEDGAYGIFGNAEFGLHWRASQARLLFDRPLTATPGARFAYNSAGTAVLANILAARVGMPVDAYADAMLFKPLGITHWEWKTDLRGRPLAFAGLRLRPRDLARIGRLMLSQGVWEGRQVVPNAWVAASLAPQTPTGDGLSYGRQWWGGSVAALGALHRWSAGFGNGGQRLFVVPSLDLVVVITAGDYDDPAIAAAANGLFRRLAATMAR